MTYVRFTLALLIALAVITLAVFHFLASAMVAMS